MSLPNQKMAGLVYNPVPFKIPNLWAGDGKSDIPVREKCLILSPPHYTQYPNSSQEPRIFLKELFVLYIYSLPCSKNYLRWFSKILEYKNVSNMDQTTVFVHKPQDYLRLINKISLKFVPLSISEFKISKINLNLYKILKPHHINENKSVKCNEE